MKKGHLAVQETMTRREYIIKQKEGKGRRVFGVFPAQYPREILWAMNVVPVEIWDPPLELSYANAHLQPNICSVVKLGLELIMQGKCDGLDGFLFPHTCDSIQNLASIIHDCLGLKKPCYFFYHPREPYRGSSRIYYLGQLKSLVAALESQLGPLDLDELKRRIQQGQHISMLLQKLYDQRAKGKLAASNWDFYRMIRQGEYLFPDDFIPELEAFLARSEEEAKEGHPSVILSGIMPNPLGILTFLDNLGVVVAYDDFMIGSRRLLIPPSDLIDPFEQLTDCYFRMPPCPTKTSPIGKRRDYLLRMIEATDARGVIFYIVKFCEPEWFDIPNLVDELRKREIPALVLETELNQGFSGQVTNRLEAFMETIGL